MKKKPTASFSTAESRRQSGTKLRQKARKNIALALPASEKETQRLVYELQVQKIKLELQNEELVKSRAQVEAGLQQYTELYDFAPVGYFTLARNGAIYRANLTGAQLLGVERARLSKRLFRLFVSPGSRSTFNTFLKRVFESNRKMTCEVELQKDGSALLWAFIEAASSKDGKECYAMVEDITERKRSEEELRVSELRFKQISEHTREWIWEVDTNGLYTYSSPVVKEIMGYEPDEIVGKEYYYGFSDPEERERIKQSALGAIARKEQFNNLIKRNRHKDGREVILSTSGIPMLDRKKKLIGYRGVDIDITERVRADKEFSTLAHALRSISESVYITDMSDRVLFVNEAFLKTYGFDEHELMGQKISIIRSSNNLPRIMREIHPATLRGGWRGELLNRKKDGTDFPVALSTSVIYNDIGQPFALVGVATDISENRIAEIKRKSLEAQFQQSQKLESLGTLASGIAHDFNNILSIIIGYASLLERLPSDPDIVKRNTEAITKAGVRGAALVKQLLSFARKTDILVESVRLNEIVNEVSKLVDVTFAKTITTSLNLVKQLPSIVADASQIHQVILNLCVNARDAMPEGGMLSIATFMIHGELIRSKFIRADAIEYVGLRVADTGIGMDEATQKRIFEPFFTTKGIGKGTGLGLSMVFDIVESHKGFIEVQSVLRKGTTFQVYFPQPLQFVKIEEVKEQSTEEIPGGSETILLIEDEELLRGLVTGILVSKGYTVLTAEDGKAGVEQYQRHQKEIGLVLSDLGLPKLSGYEAFKRMKKLNPKIKFILATGFIEPETTSEMLRAGIIDIIHKPYSEEKMLRSVRSILDIS